MVTRGGGPSSRSVDRAPSCHEVMSRPARVADVEHLGEMRLRFALSDGLVAQERAIEPRPPRGKERHAAHRGIGVAATRSEEHKSELQSLMRISYAVVCLKKKREHNN